MDAVVLSIRLASSVRGLQRFLKGIAEAPEELKRLLDLLEQLELILEQVGIIVERQRGNPSLENTGVLASVLRAVGTCENKLNLLEGVVEATKNVPRVSNRSSRVLGSFCLACKKKDILEIEHHLREAIDLLSLSMTTNMSFVQFGCMGQLHDKISDTHQSTESIRNELVLLRKSLLRTPKGASEGSRAINGRCSNNVDVSTKFKLSVKHSMSFQSYVGLFGKLLVRRTWQPASFTEDELQPKSETYSTTSSSWAFFASFLSLVVEYQSLRACGLVQRALRIYPLIPSDHPVWRMCWLGDLRGIQTMISAQQVSPFGVDVRGQTLLHHASNRCRANVCEFLFDLGLNGQETTIDGLLPYLGSQMSLNDPSEVWTTHSIFSSRSEYFDEAEFFALLFMDPVLEIELETFNCLVRDLVSKMDIDAFDTSPLCPAMKMFHYAEPNARNRWKELIHGLLSLSPDLHKCYDWGGGTVLGQILNIAKSSFESRELGEEWLAILEDFGIDVAEYLRTERLCQYKWGHVPMLIPPWSASIEDGPDYKQRYQHIIFSENIPRISWDWYNHPGRPASEVLHEFRNFGPGSHEFQQDYQWPEAMFNWPYFYPQWHACFYVSSEILSHETKNSLVKLYDARFERRWLKKIQIFQKRLGFGKSSKVPGAWID